jgi:hypothetical protein
VEKVAKYGQKSKRLARHALMLQLGPPSCPLQGYRLATFRNLISRFPAGLLTQDGLVDRLEAKKRRDFSAPKPPT